MKRYKIHHALTPGGGRVASRNLARTKVLADLKATTTEGPCVYVLHFQGVWQKPQPDYLIIPKEAKWLTKSHRSTSR